MLMLLYIHQYAGIYMLVHVCVKNVIIFWYTIIDTHFDRSVFTNQNKCRDLFRRREQIYCINGSFLVLEAKSLLMHSPMTKYIQNQKLVLRGNGCGSTQKPIRKKECRIGGLHAFTITVQFNVYKQILSSAYPLSTAMQLLMIQDVIYYLWDYINPYLHK